MEIETGASRGVHAHGSAAREFIQSASSQMRSTEAIAPRQKPRDKHEHGYTCDRESDPSRDPRVARVVWGRATGL